MDNTNEKKFVEIVFKGERFEDTGIDVDLLPLIKTYQEILNELIKGIYSQKRGDLFPLSLEAVLCKLKLTEFKQGSTACVLERISKNKELLINSKQKEISQEAKLKFHDIIEMFDSDNPDLEYRNSIYDKIKSLCNPINEEESLTIRDPETKRESTIDYDRKKRIINYRLQKGKGHEKRDIVGKVYKINFRSKLATFDLFIEKQLFYTIPLPIEYEEVLIDALKKRNELWIRVIGYIERDNPKKWIEVIKIGTLDDFNIVTDEQIIDSLFGTLPIEEVKEFQSSILSDRKMHMEE